MNMFHILIIIILLMSLNFSEQSITRSLKIHRKKSFVALLFTNNSTLYNSNGNKKKLCEWVKRLKHQNRLCWKRRGLAEALWNAKNLAVRYCIEHFRYEQWDCSRKAIFFRKVYRETAYMYSLASSALMFSVARACAEGKLAGCKCADHGKAQNTSDWQWGGCGDNSKYAKRFTRKFLQLNTKSENTDDSPNAILKYNVELGLKVVMKNEEKICRCHGVSGSCIVKICWKKIRSFKTISNELKKLYHNAVQVAITNEIRSIQANKSSHKLLFLDSSPSFCPSTEGRQCRNADNCATLCCGRGFYSSSMNMVERCNCRWRTRNSFEVHCQQCLKNESIYFCK